MHVWEADHLTLEISCVLVTGETIYPTLSISLLPVALSVALGLWPPGSPLSTLAYVFMLILFILR